MQSEKPAQQRDQSERMYDSLEKAALKAKPESLEDWRAQAKRCDIPVGKLIHAYAVNQIRDLNLTDNPPKAYNAAVLSKAPGWSAAMEVAAEEKEGPHEGVPTFISSGPGRQLTAEDLKGLQELNPTEWRQVRIVEPADYQEKLARAHRMAAELSESNPERLIGLAQEGVERRRKIARDGAAYAGAKLPTLGEEPKVAANAMTEGKAWAGQIEARNQWGRGKSYYESLTTERYPGEFAGMLSDDMFKRQEPELKSIASQETERQREIGKLVSVSAYAKKWQDQANRLQMVPEAALEGILEAHAVRALILSDRANILEHLEHPSSMQNIQRQIRALKPQELLRKAEEDMVCCGPVYDKVVNPRITGSGVSPKHTFMVIGPGSNPITGTDVVGDSDLAMGSKGIYDVLIREETRPLPQKNLDSIEEDGDRAKFMGAGFKYLPLPELLKRMKEVFSAKEKQENGTVRELDDRVALMAVGRYLAQKRVRMFGYDTPLVRLVVNRPEEGTAKENTLGQLDTGDDLMNVVRHNADRIGTTLKEHPYPLTMESVRPICFPYKPGIFKSIFEKMAQGDTDEGERKALIRDLAYIGLGYALEENRVSLTVQADEIIVAKAGKLG